MKILEELSEILNLLTDLNEENFDFVFYDIKYRMIKVRKEISKLEEEGFFNQNEEERKKIEEYANLISEQYDNKLKTWRNKIGHISEMLATSINEKKILNYLRR